MYATRDRVTACFIWCACFTAFIRVPAAHFIPPRVSGERRTARSDGAPSTMPRHSDAPRRVLRVDGGQRPPMPPPPLRFTARGRINKCVRAGMTIRSLCAPSFSPITKRLSGAVESVTSTKRLFSTRPRQKKGKRSAERRIGLPMSAKSGVRLFFSATIFRRSRLRHSPPASTPMAQLQNRVSSDGRATGFCSLRQPRKKMPRLSTLRADRSLCRSTGDPKSPGCGSDKLSRAGTASRSRQSRHRLTSLRARRWRLSF